MLTFDVKEECEDGYETIEPTDKRTEHNVSGGHSSMRKIAIKPSRITLFHPLQETETGKDEVCFDPLLCFKTEEEPEESMYVVEPKTTFCRSCFEFLTPTVDQFEVNGELLAAFEDLTSQVVQPHDLTPTFCEPCSRKILMLRDFKCLTIVKQEKFQHLLEADEIQRLHEVSEVHLETKNFEEICQPVKLIVEKRKRPRRLPQRFLDTLKVKQEVKEAPPTNQKTASKALKYKDFCTVSNGVYSCNECKRFSSNIFKKFQSHYYKRHSVEKFSNNLKYQEFCTNYRGVFNCKTCKKYKTKSFASFQGHYQRTHSIKTVKDTQKYHDFCTITDTEVKCNICDYSSDKLKNFAGHYYKYHFHQGKVYRCDICSHVFKAAVYLKEHIERKHEKKKDATCQFCNRMFYTANACK